VPAAYPLGFDLSYTTFQLDDATAEQHRPESLPLRTTLRNTGDRDGRHVVQVYGVRLDGDRAGERALLGFAPVRVSAGRSHDVTVSASLRPLADGNPTPSRSASPTARSASRWPPGPATPTVKTQLTLP
jgi:beta-glucosidase